MSCPLSNTTADRARRRLAGRARDRALRPSPLAGARASGQAHRTRPGSLPVPARALRRGGPPIPIHDLRTMLLTPAWHVEHRAQQGMVRRARPVPVPACILHLAILRHRSQPRRSSIDMVCCHGFVAQSSGRVRRPERRHASEHSAGELGVKARGDCGDCIRDGRRGHAELDRCSLPGGNGTRRLTFSARLSAKQESKSGGRRCPACQLSASPQIAASRSSH